MKRKILFLILFLSILLIIGIYGAYLAFRQSERGSYIGPLWVKGKTKYYSGGGGEMYPTLAWCSHYGGPEDCSKSANEEAFRIATELIIKEDNFKPERGMIVAFKNRGGFDRIIGLPGERVIFNNGYVYINGSLLQEPYVIKKASTYGDKRIPNCKEITVPENKLFVLGDNRFFSLRTT